MPEVCEVRLTAEILNKYIAGYDLIKINVVDKHYKKVPELLNKVKKNLPLEVITVDSKGKLMWIEFYDNDSEKSWYMTVGFGLEGMWSFEEHKYSKMNFEFTSHGHDKITIWWNDMLSYGNIIFYNKDNEFKAKLDTLGMDFLTTKFTDHELCTKYNKISESKYGSKMLVELLMDQKKLGSGLGNYLTPEILYRAKLSPRRKINSLTKEECKILSHTIKKVVKLVYYTGNVGYMNYMTQYLGKLKRDSSFHNDVDIDNRKFKFLVYRRKIDDHGNPVTADKIVKGRTTYWVKHVQK